MIMNMYEMNKEEDDKTAVALDMATLKMLDSAKG